MILEVTNTTTTIVLQGLEKIMKPDPIKMIDAYLKVRVDGAFHSKLFKSNKWDGYKHFVSYKKFGTGFLYYVVEYLKSEGLDFTISDRRENMPRPVHPDHMVTVFGDMELRDYQLDIVTKCITNMVTLGDTQLFMPRGIVDFATNAGKNLVAAGIFANFDKPKMMFLIHSHDIYVQAIKYFEELFPGRIGHVGDGSYMFRDFTICMAKTLLNMVKKHDEVKYHCTRTNILFVDECHHAAASEYQEVISYINAGARFFVSGTPLAMKDKVKKMSILGQSGQILGKISNKELVDRGVSQKPKIKFLLNDTPLKDLKSLLSYEKEIAEAIHFSEHRMRLMLPYIEERKGKFIIITFITIEHGYFMFNFLRKYFVDLVVDIVHGDDANRDQKIEDYGNGKIDILVASMIVKEGLNLKIIRAAFLAQGGKSLTMVRQLFGRMVRADGVNEDVEMFEFMDVGNYVYEHSKQRALHYLRDGFEISTDYKAYRKYIPDYLRGSVTKRK